MTGPAVEVFQGEWPDGNERVSRRRPDLTVLSPQSESSCLTRLDAEPRMDASWSHADHERLIMKLGGLAITGVTRQWMRTLDYQVCFYDPRRRSGRSGLSGAGHLPVLARVHSVPVLPAW